MKVLVNPVYTSTACNRIPEICDWNSEGLICFGASNAVVVYDTNIKGSDPLTVLNHHTSRVNSVKWLRRPDGTSNEFISCSADKTAAIWSSVNGTWKVTSTLTGHGQGITCITGVYTTGDDVVVFTGSIDSSVRVWERTNGVLTFKQVINLNSGLCLTLHAHLLPIVKKPILFCALDDHKIHIFTGDDYHRVHILSGHDDWVRGLDVLDVDDTTLLLASASQDTYIRLWRIQKHVDHQPDMEIRVEERVFPAFDHQWAVKLDAVLAGHEGWVYGVQWHPGVFDRELNKKIPTYRLLSSSLDKTLIIWEPDTPSRGAGEGEGDSGGVWVERVRVGEVGGNGLGFYGSRFGPNGTSFLGHGYNGSFHIWNLNKETKQWEPAIVCGGHFSAVEDVRWEPSGRYIMSVSADQTTRVHAPWNTDASTEWHEIARPQVHGYDMASLAIISPTVFASAAEEKVIRVFEAPHNFVHNFKNITGDTLGDLVGGPEGASVPSLGLSNKAVFTGDESQSDFEDDNDGYFVPVNLTAPPTEETLMQNTLWPEIQKLYGHGYEVFALDASPDGSLLASTCKATNVEHAAVLIWDTKTWEEIQKLPSHSLTVTQLAFSPDSQHLLSVSRDRSWALFKRQHGNVFERCAFTNKANGVHSRIIWCCAWSHDSALFGTGSRDGKVCLWSTAEVSNSEDVLKPSTLGDYALYGKPLELPNSSVTAISFAPIELERARIIAAGLESGLILLFKYSVDGWSLMRELDNSAAHHLTVKRLTFKRSPEESGDVMLASCGADFLVRIYRISIAC